ncbi:MAG TPA: sigma-54 dependent transcriptional regulator [Bdellovibrionota bacterium]|nr:sigma-54 dependent transcriptional regulator [Bdellovibrionota bacterium]
MRVLYVEDEEIKRTTVVHFLNRNGDEATGVETAEEALIFLSKNCCDVLVSDVRLPGMGGTELLRHVRAEYPDLTVLIVTAYATIDLAVEVMRDGAYDFITKPFKNDALLLKLQRIAKFRSRQQENLELRRALDLVGALPDLVGGSPEMRRIGNLIRTVAPGPSTVLVLGESGTGKELVARALHQASRRNQAHFVAFNCAALPPNLVESELFGHEKGAFTGAVERHKGRFERADGGTLFLDDVDAMPIEAQAKLLRVLEEHEIERVGSSSSVHLDVRVVASSNPRLRENVTTGRFREDLFFRLNVIPILLPPLRERTEDIEPLVRHFIEQQRAQRDRALRSFSAEALSQLKRCPWPGNVRELKNLVERLCWLHRNEVVELEDLPEEYIHVTSPNGSESQSPAIDVTRKSFKDFVEEAERAYFSWAMEKSNGNLSKAARLLRIPRSTLHDRLNALEGRPGLPESDSS